MKKLILTATTALILSSGTVLAENVVSKHAHQLKVANCAESITLVSNELIGENKHTVHTNHHDELSYMSSFIVIEYPDGSSNTVELNASETTEKGCVVVATSTYNISQSCNSLAEELNGKVSFLGNLITVSRPDANFYFKNNGSQCIVQKKEVNWFTKPKI